MLIPVFGSCPTHLNPEQDAARRLIVGELGHFGLEWRSVGQTDYPAAFPLREVLMLAKRCSGGVILGFSQFETAAGVLKRGSHLEAPLKDNVAFPTPWNQLEAGILFGLELPLIVFREHRVHGGVFDNGVTDLFIHEMPIGKISVKGRRALREVLGKWARLAQNRYYGTG